MMYFLCGVCAVIFISVETRGAEFPWRFERTWESARLINENFVLTTGADVSRNGIKELFVTDFGQFGEHIGGALKEKNNLFVFEWDTNELKLRLHRQWDQTQATSDRINNVSEYGASRRQKFLGSKAKQMTSWQIDNSVIVETMPPFIAVEWQKGKYIVHDAHAWEGKESLIKSLALPWANPTCYKGLETSKKNTSRECMIGVRDFGGNGDPKIISILEEATVKDKQYKQSLRVRKLTNGFPVEWEMQSPQRFVLSEPIDRLNEQAAFGLLVRVFRSSLWYVIESGKDGSGYQLRSLKTEGLKGLETFNLPDFYLRHTQSKSEWEYWGYGYKKAPDGRNIAVLRRIRLGENYNIVSKEEVDFSRHPFSLGITLFDVHDIDNDGLDEIILLERTGQREFGEDMVRFSNVKDYIHILKWTGSKYQTMWVSPPYSKRGTKFLVEDIKNTGKKQLVVLSPYGTIQIWEKQ